MDDWIVFFEVLSRLLQDYEQMKDDEVDETVIHHICAQMKHYVSGLKFVMEFLKNESESGSSDFTTEENTFIGNVQSSVSCLIDFLCNDAIPTLNNKLDMTVYEPDFITRFNDS